MRVRVPSATPPSARSTQPPDSEAEFTRQTRGRLNPPHHPRWVPGLLHRGLLHRLGPLDSADLVRPCRSDFPNTIAPPLARWNASAGRPNPSDQVLPTSLRPRLHGKSVSPAFHPRPWPHRRPGALRVNPRSAWRPLRHEPPPHGPRFFDGTKPGDLAREQGRAKPLHGVSKARTARLIRGSRENGPSPRDPARRHEGRPRDYFCSEYHAI